MFPGFISRKSFYQAKINTVMNAWPACAHMQMDDILAKNSSN